MEVARSASGGELEKVLSVQDSPHLPGEVGVWVLVLGDSLIFVLLFVSFLAYRSQELLLFNSSQLQLNANFGALNTLLLLASSWLVVGGLHAIRRDLISLSVRLLQLSWICGACFVAVKVVEYSAKLSEGVTPLTNSFFMFYFVLTGLHFVHLLIGLGVLAYMIHKIKKTSIDGQSMIMLESGATYWHLVDLLWIVLFPLIYLVR